MQHSLSFAFKQLGEGKGYRTDKETTSSEWTEEAAVGLIEVMNVYFQFVPQSNDFIFSF